MSRLLLFILQPQAIALVRKKKQENQSYSDKTIQAITIIVCDQTH